MKETRRADNSGRGGISAACGVILCILAFSGCTTIARAIPASEEPSPEQILADDNRRLREQYDAEHALNMRLAYELEKTRIELEKARSALAASDAKPAETVPAFQDFEVSRIRFGLLTGISNWDGEPGADGFKVYLLTEDSEGTTLKRKGNCLVELIDIARGKEVVIMSWPVPAETLAGTWQSFPPGWRLQLPWQADVPWGDEAVLRATFTDAHGREFQVSRVFRLEGPNERGGEAAPPEEETRGEDAQ